MAAASYSEYVRSIDEDIQRLPTELCEKICLEFVLTKLRERADVRRIDEAIQKLPPEIREKIYKELVAIKMRERKEMGWNGVHDDIKDAPFCEKRLRITKVLFCFKCNSCQRNGLCEVCHKNGETHNLGYPIYGIEDYDEIFIKAY